MERLEELTHRPSRQLGVWIVAGASAFVVFAAIAGSLGNDEESVAKDPFDSFGRAAQLAGLAPRIEDNEEPAPKVDRTALLFPEVLTAAVMPQNSTVSGDSRPEVEAAIAAAAAELQHPDPLFEPSLDDTVAPAAAVVTGSPQADKLAAADDLNVPPRTSPAAPAPSRSSSGQDGLYTLQVVSYQSSAEANAFAEELRARGHASFVTRADIDDRGTFYRVRIGPFDSKRDAQSYRAEFEDREQMNTFIVKRRD